MDRWDVVVIGGGLAGLAAAAQIGRGGAKVALLERAGELGGRARTQREHGYALNLGPHALYRGGAAERVLRRLAVPYRAPKAVVSGAAVWTGGGLASLPASPGALLLDGSRSWATKLGLGRFLTRLALGARTRLAGEQPAELSVGEWLRAEVADDEARALAAALIRLATYAHPPERLAASAAARQLAAATFSGVGYVDGGWRVLVDGLRARAEAAGVALRPGRRALAVEFGDGGVEAVRTEEGPLAARAVVLAVSPDVARSLLPADVAARLHGVGAAPARAAALDLGLAELPRPELGFVVGVDQPLYFSVHTRVAQLAPPGHHVVHVARYLAPEERPAPDVVEAELEAFLEAVQPGWRAHVRARRFLPRLTVMQQLPLAESGGLAGRPGCDALGVPGVLLAGDWVGNEGLLADASFASAEAAAALALARVGSAEVAPPPGERLVAAPALAQFGGAEA